MKKGFLLSSLFLLAASMVHAESTITFGDWAVAQVVNNDSNTSNYVALTQSESGAFFGMVCFADYAGCMWVISIETGCNIGAKIPVLVNAKVGSDTVEMLCDTKQESSYRYLLTNFDDMTRLVKDSDVIGLAMPLESGRFQVLRFSLNGQSEATSKVQELFYSSLKSSPKPIKDELL